MSCNDWKLDYMKQNLTFELRKSIFNYDQNILLVVVVDVVVVVVVLVVVVLVVVLVARNKVNRNK